MSQRVAVAKMHGARNDFVLIDERAPHVTDYPSFARRVCDRRGGIGADGLLVVLPSRSADACMRIFNADGSEAEMCGNGMRCFVRWLYERGGLHREHLVVETLAGPIACTVRSADPGHFVVEVRITEPSFPPPDGTAGIAVSTGNPHRVYFVDDVAGYELAALAGPAPRANVHIVQVLDEHGLRVRHFERGVGETPACGTGIAASAAAAIRTQRAVSPVRVEVPGGVVDVAWGEQGLVIRGEAVHVFDTEVDLPPASGSAR
ncbi:diaminopimelate epimerase [bacterium]|nr:MAG: diaminopimelate epimerase [bacterium]